MTWINLQIASLGHAVANIQERLKLAVQEGDSQVSYLKDRILDTDKHMLRLGDIIARNEEMRVDHVAKQDSRVDILAGRISKHDEEIASLKKQAHAPGKITSQQAETIIQLRNDLSEFKAYAEHRMDKQREKINHTRADGHSEATARKALYVRVAELEDNAPDKRANLDPESTVGAYIGEHHQRLAELEQLAAKVSPIVDPHRRQVTEARQREYAKAVAMFNSRLAKAIAPHPSQVRCHSCGGQPILCQRGNVCGPNPSPLYWCKCGQCGTSTFEYTTPEHAAGAWKTGNQQ